MLKQLLDVCKEVFINLVYFIQLFMVDKSCSSYLEPRMYQYFNSSLMYHREHSFNTSCIKEWTRDIFDVLSFFVVTIANQNKFISLKQKRITLELPRSKIFNGSVKKWDQDVDRTFHSRYSRQNLLLLLSVFKDGPLSWLIDIAPPFWLCCLLVFFLILYPPY